MENPSQKLLLFEAVTNLRELLSFDRFRRGRHLIDSPWRDGVAIALNIHGASHKNTVVVQRTPEEAFAASEYYADWRVVCADAADIAKEERRRLVTALLDLRGPLTEEAMQTVRDILVHGMAADGVFMLQFDVGEETGTVKEAVNAARDRTAAKTSVGRVFSPVGEPMEDATLDAVMLRVRVLRRGLLELLQGARSWWTPTNIFMYDRSDGAALATCLVQGVVQRDLRVAQDATISTAILATKCTATEEHLRSRVLRMDRSLARGKLGFDPAGESFLRRQLHKLFNIDKETLDQWRMEQATETPTSGQ